MGPMRRLHGCERAWRPGPTRMRGMQTAIPPCIIYIRHPEDAERALIRAGADPNLLDEDGKPHDCRTFECLAKKTYRRER